MDHVVYLDRKAKELDNLRNGTKTMIIRDAMGRKLPHGRVDIGDTLYCIENNGDGFVKAKATVATTFHSTQLTSEESLALIENNQPYLQLDDGLKKRFGGKRYMVLITVKDFSVIDAFRIDRSAYGNMDDWLPVGDINTIKVS